MRQRIAKRTVAEFRTWRRRLRNKRMAALLGSVSALYSTNWIAELVAQDSMVTHPGFGKASIVSSRPFRIPFQVLTAPAPASIVRTAPLTPELARLVFGLKVKP